MSNAAAISRTGILAFTMAGAMIAVGYAAVPLYKLFCEATGFGGTIQRVDGDIKPGQGVAGKIMSIRFDANHVNELPWEFKPERTVEKVTIGEREMAFFTAKNLSDKPITGRASYNVTPTQAGRYFNKIQCFCFTEQTLQPGQQVRMPVIYYVDPGIITDPDANSVQEITLSYTFHVVDEADKPS
jgi:cytochrome c oxidase assembly protein subunit 11